MIREQIGHIDWQGLATFVTALGTLITVIGGIVLQVFQKLQSAKNSVKLDAIQEHVNGNTSKLLAIVDKAVPPKTGE